MHRILHASIISAAVPRRVMLYRRLLRRLSWGGDRIRQYQERQLRMLIRHCWQYVPFYRAYWSDSISGPDDIRTIQDLQRLPILSKDVLRENAAALVSTSPWVDKVAAITGGSTGKPISFYMTRYDEQLSWAQMYVGWSWAGYRLGDPFLAVGGESIGVGLSDNRTRRDSAMNRWISSGSNLTLERARVLASSDHFARIRFMYGYPNSIRELCERFATLRVRPPALTGIVCTAEVMRPEVRQRIVEILGDNVVVLDQYGLNDGGLHACEGPDQDGLHLSFHRGILEILDDNNSQITCVGSRGRAIATSISNLAMPFVRYETGDIVRWHSFEPAQSGIGWPRISQVEGRAGDVIYTPSGRSIPMPGLTLVMRWLKGLNSYQFIQTSSQTVTVRLDRGAEFSMSESEVQDYLRQKITDEIVWTVAWGPPELTKNSKLLIVRNDWLRSLGLQRPN